MLTALACVLVCSADSQEKPQTPQKFVLLKFLGKDLAVFVVAENDLSKFHVKGKGAEIVRNCAEHKIQVSGSGEISYKTHRITFSKAGVFINGKRLSPPSTSFVLLPNGEVREGFVRTFDREPLRN